MARRSVLSTATILAVTIISGGLAAFAQNTDCPLATLGFAAGVDFDRLLFGTRFRAPFGQSPFAIQRGLAFEKMLRDNDYALTLGLLREPSFPSA